MISDKLKYSLLGKRLTAKEEQGQRMLTLVIDEVCPFGELIEIYGDDSEHIRHEFPITREQVDELLNKGEINTLAVDFIPKSKERGKLDLKPWIFQIDINNANN